jgi:hypothetical protein
MDRRGFIAGVLAAAFTPVARLFGTSIPCQGRTVSNYLREMEEPVRKDHFEWDLQPGAGDIWRADYMRQLQAMKEPWRSQLLYGDFE